MKRVAAITVVVVLVLLGLRALGSAVAKPAVVTDGQHNPGTTAQRPLEPLMFPL